MAKTILKQCRIPIEWDELITQELGTLCYVNTSDFIKKAIMHELQRNHKRRQLQNAPKSMQKARLIGDLAWVIEEHHLLMQHCETPFVDYPPEEHKN